MNPGKRTLSDFNFGKAARQARARRTDPVTSHQAAESVKDLRGSQRAVLKLFHDMPAGYGMTDEDIAKHYPTKGLLQQSPSGLRTRRKELVDAGYLEDSGERRRMTTGRKAIVWQLATDSGTPRTPPTQAAALPAGGLGEGYETFPGDVPEVIPGQITIDELLGDDG